MKIWEVSWKEKLGEIISREFNNEEEAMTTYGRISLLTFATIVSFERK